MSGDHGRQGNNEAAKYRRRLREAEQREVDLLERVRALQLEVVRYELRGVLVNWLDFVELIGLDAVLDSDGELDRDLLHSRVETQLIMRPYLALPR